LFNFKANNEELKEFKCCIGFAYWIFFFLLLLQWKVVNERRGRKKKNQTNTRKKMSMKRKPVGVEY
jgi:hypothetical protein